MDRPNLNKIHTLEIDSESWPDKDSESKKPKSQSVIPLLLATLCCAGLTYVWFQGDLRKPQVVNHHMNIPASLPLEVADQDRVESVSQSKPVEMVLNQKESRYTETAAKDYYLLGLQSEGEKIAEIEVSVPVLAEKEKLVWSHAHLMQAHQILEDLRAQRKKVRDLEIESEKLLESWTRLEKEGKPPHQKKEPFLNSNALNYEID